MNQPISNAQDNGSVRAAWRGTDAGVGMGVRVLTVQQAADLLHMQPRSMRRLIHAGDIPAARIGRRLLILSVDLYAYLRAKCVPRVMQGVHVEDLAWHSTDAVTRPSGGLGFNTVDERYRKALGLQTK